MRAPLRCRALTTAGLALATALAAHATGCDRRRDAEAALAGRSPEVRRVFTLRCATCHGRDGAGNGPGAAQLNPRPRDFGDRAWQRETSDDYLRRVIVGGGAAVGRSPAMPPNPDLGERPALLDELVAVLRALGR